MGTLSGVQDDSQYMGTVSGLWDDSWDMGTFTGLQNDKGHEYSLGLGGYGYPLGMTG